MLRSVALPTFEFPAEIRANLGVVEQRFQSVVNSKVDLVEETSSYILNSAGKRLRPALMLLAVFALPAVWAGAGAIFAFLMWVGGSYLLRDITYAIVDPRIKVS